MSTFREFLTWWIGQLADLLPERWRRIGLSGGDALVIAPVGPLVSGADSAHLSLRRNGREQSLGQFGLASEEFANLPLSSGKPVVLQLAGADVLSKTLTLPLSAERELDQVLAFELDRETPFSAEEIYWNHRVAERNRERGQLSVRLFLVPRAWLAALLDPLTRAGITPKRAEITTGPDRGCSLPLDGKGGRLYDRSGRRLMRWPAAACCAALALAAIAVPFMRQSAALARLDQKVVNGRLAVAEAEKLRKEIDRLSATVNLIKSERDKAGRPLAVLAALTRLLPDDTYLFEFQQRQHSLTLSGRSAGASRLIGALAASPELRNPAFAAPVMRIAATNSEGFSITAEVGQ